MSLADFYLLDDVNSEIQELEEALAINDALGDEWSLVDIDEHLDRLEYLYSLRESLEDSEFD